MATKSWLDRILKKLFAPRMVDAMDFTFVNLDETDRIVLTTNLNKAIKTTEDQALIRKIIDIVKTQSAAWDVPPGGVPVTNLRLNFFKGDRPLGNVGLGRKVLTAHQMGGFYAKSNDGAIRRDVLALLGVEDI